VFRSVETVPQIKAPANLGTHIYFEKKFPDSVILLDSNLISQSITAPTERYC